MDTGDNEDNLIISTVYGQKFTGKIVYLYFLDIGHIAINITTSERLSLHRFNTFYITRKYQIKGFYTVKHQEMGINGRYRIKGIFEYKTNSM